MKRSMRLAHTMTLLFALILTVSIVNTRAKGKLPSDTPVALMAPGSALLPQTREVRNVGSEALDYYERGLAAQRARQFENALNAFGRAIELKPDFAEAYNNLGHCYYSLGKYWLAVDAFKRAIHIKPETMIAYSNLGNTYMALRQYSKSIETLKQAHRLDPTDPVTMCSLGNAYYKVKRYKLAVESFEQAVELKKDYPEAHYNLGVAYLAVKDKERALEQHRLLQTVAPSLANSLFTGIYRNKILTVTQ